jgi:hypothetical protein
MMITSFANEESYKKLFFLNLVVLALAYKLLCTGGAPTVRFAPVVPWAKTGPAPSDFTVIRFAAFPMELARDQGRCS